MPSTNNKASHGPMQRLLATYSEHAGASQTPRVLQGCAQYPDDVVVYRAGTTDNPRESANATVTAPLADYCTAGLYKYRYSHGSSGHTVHVQPAAQLQCQIANLCCSHSFSSAHLQQAGLFMLRGDGLPGMI
jgi:hypothetical protein